MINKELPSNHLTTTHHALAPLPAVDFSESFLNEVNRVATGQPRQGGIDLSRYEAPDAPASDSGLDTRRQALRNAYVSSTYLSGRYTNLSLLDDFGKNAWLIGNSQAEEVLQGLEQELDRVKTETDNINKARKATQEHSRAELLGLEENWKRGVGKILEIQVATDRLRQLIVERRRNHTQPPT